MFNASPNGIHRVDAALARYFLSVRTPPSNGTWFPRLLTHRVVSHEAALEVLDAIDAHFAETDDPKLDSIYAAIKDWVLRDAPIPASVPTRVRRRPKIPVTKALSWAVRHGLDLRATAARSLPRDARYFNASHYGLAVPGAFDWLDSRPDVKAIFHSRHACRSRRRSISPRRNLRAIKIACAIWLGTAPAPSFQRKS